MNALNWKNIYWDTIQKLISVVITHVRKSRVITNARNLYNHHRLSQALDFRQQKTTSLLCSSPIGSPPGLQCRSSISGRLFFLVKLWVVDPPSLPRHCLDLPGVTPIIGGLGLGPTFTIHFHYFFSGCFKMYGGNQKQKELRFWIDQNMKIPQAQACHVTCSARRSPNIA